MENRDIKERLSGLQNRIKEEGTDYYLIPSSDYHNSEYVGEYFRLREYFSGFSGSNATLLVSEAETCLWTDGRYFIQAAAELEGSGIRLMRMGEEGVPSLEEYLEDKMKEGQTLGFDGRTVTAAFGQRLEKELAGKHISFRFGEDVAGPLWKERPCFPCGMVFSLEETVSGMSLDKKAALVREGMKAQGAGAFLLSRLDDIMWLLNIRGCDVPCNPVALSYVWMTREDLHVFLQKEAVSPEIRLYFEENNVIIEDYHHIVPFLRGLEAGQSVLADMQNLSYLLYRAVADDQKLLEGENPTQVLKAVKNPVELKNMQEVYRRDSAVLTKFIYWLKKNIGRQELDEMSAAAYLDGLRSHLEGFMDLSFPTISAYQENGAMCHYETTEESNKKLRPEGLYLVDSGGQYLGGTTDVTRTVALGPVSEEMKRHFTAVACGMLRLADAKFLEGCSGRNLDILARLPLWESGLDYKHGTGHGIGYMLNVHEGPQNIRWKFNREAGEAVLEAGMVVSDEPGLYLEGKYGIRTENILTVQKGIKNEYGQFLHFAMLTWVPIDREALDVRFMTREDRKLLNEYHSMVYEKISPLLEEEEREWLREVTHEI